MGIIEQSAAASNVQPTQNNLASNPLSNLFQLVCSFVDLTKRTLCAHPAPTETQNANLNTEISARLSDCLSNEQPLVSFHSELGFSNCKHLHNPDNPPGFRNAKRPSLIHQCLQASKEGKSFDIEHDGQMFSVTVEFNDLHESNLPDDIKFMKGEVRLANKQNNNDVRRIPFIEFCPKYDGYALSSNVLLKCHSELNQFRTGNELTKLDGQFSSAKGIGRAPSLIVLDQFKEMCEKNLINSETVEGAKNLVTQTVNQLITDARDNSSNPNLIPHQSQIDELTAACFEIYQEMIFNRDDQQAEHPAPSSAESHNSDDIPGLVEASELEEEDEWVMDDDDLSSDSSIASIKVQNADAEGVPFNVNYWAWNKESETYKEVKNKWAEMTEDEKTNLIKKLDQASKWVIKHLSENNGNFEGSNDSTDPETPEVKMQAFYQLLTTLTKMENGSMKDVLSDIWLKAQDAALIAKKT